MDIFIIFKVGHTPLFFLLFCLVDTVSKCMRNAGGILGLVGFFIYFIGGGIVE